MVVGDKKQAAILGIVALIIVSVGVFEFIPKGAKPIVEAIRATDAAAAAKQKQINEELPTAITSSPFSKPQALPASTAPDKPASGVDHAPNMALKHRTGSGGTVPTLDLGQIDITPGSKAFGGPIPNPNPGENSGIDQKPIKEQTRTATLDAVLKIERWTAIVTVSGHEEPMHCEAGKSIGGHPIIDIDDSGMTLLIGKRLVVVSVGSSVSL